MFNLLGWSQHKSDDSSNLTMHQIFRLLYLSQSSDATRIFRKENPRADKDSIRRAIADFLLGLDDLSTHELRQKLIIKEKDRDRITSDLNAFMDILGEDSMLTMKVIENKIDTFEEDIKKAIIERDELIKEIDESKAKKKETRLSQIRFEIKSAVSELNSISNEISKIDSEIRDCQLFDQNLDFRLKSIIESKTTYTILGKVDFQYCPVCFTPITESEDDECMLCKQKHEDVDYNERYLESINELKYQKRQNQKIIDHFKELRVSYHARLQDVDNTVTTKQSDLYRISGISSDREQIIEEYAIRIANIKSDIKEYKKKSETILRIDRLRGEKETVAGEIVSLRDKIKQLESKAAKRMNYVYTSNSKLATLFLEKDTGNEYLFNTATKYPTAIDFTRDRWFLNKRVVFSDSSNAIKKLALHIAILMHTMKDHESRSPRFAIMDFECSDLNEARSQNIQNVIRRYLDKYQNFQLILTTSKVAGELNTDEYGLGRYYDKGDYILKVEK